MRFAAAAVVLLVVGLGALLLALPRIAASDAVRARLEAAARDATGRDVRWQELSFGLLPPRLVVLEPVVQEPGGSGDPLVRAEQVDLRLALLPLLARSVVIDSLRLDGVTLRLVRTPDGVRLPGKQAPPAAGKPPAGEAPEPEAAAGVALAVRQLELTNSRLMLEDRTVSPPVTWDLGELRADVRGRSLEEPLDLDVSAALGSGGRLRVRGTTKLDGEIDLTANLEGLVLAPLAPYLGKQRRAAGALTGTVTARGPASAPESVKADLVLADGDVRVEDVGLQGRVVLKAELTGGLEKPNGSFEVDATQAALAYGSAFTKPSGTPATVRGRLVPRPDGSLGVDEVRLQIKNLDATGRLSLGKRTRVELDAPPFDLGGWDALLPALAGTQPQGKLGFEKLALATEPLEVRGRIALDPLRVSLEKGQPITVRGALEGSGAALRGAGLAVDVAGQSATVDLDVTSLATEPRYRVGARAEGADANALVTALAGKKDVLYGPLAFQSDLSGPVGGPEPALEAIQGQARLEIGKGRLRGVSLLRGAMERLASFAEAAILLGALKSQRLQRFYGDEFESVSGTFRLGQGRARTNDLTIVYRGYTADLVGSFGLVDGALDMTGKLTISEEVDQALVQAALESGAAPPEPKKKVIPLARVGGTLGSPRVDLSPQAVASLASTYALGRRREKLEQKIDETLGTGSGKEILDTLEGILGGRRKPEGTP